MLIVSKYSGYIKYSVKNSIKTRYINTYLGFIWFFLDPLLQILIYSFVFTFIFKQHVENYLVFVIIGVITWRWISQTLVKSSLSIYGRLHIIEQVPIPKPLLSLIDVLVELVLFLLGMVMVFIFILIYDVELTWHIVEIIPVIAVIFLFLYGISMFLSHVGTIISDFRPILTHVIHFGFFLSPVMYSIANFPSDVQSLLLVNPAVTFIGGLRDCLFYGSSPDYLMLGVWLFIGLGLIAGGKRLLNKFDKQYVKLK